MAEATGRGAAAPEVREVLDEIRTLIPGREIREVAMFGAVAVMVDDAMAVAVHKDRTLLVRVAADEDDRMLDEPDARRAVMGRDRDMGAGWLHIDLDPERSRLGHWVEAALRRPR
ncbi:TfoX/Sxy family protein [Microbacterium sp. 179-B 1A2 NHS]|uniref:TfoX/Sxy family protein n=1 Tax=Microbacterium sp. 179-B 1A2 NHS TaxID=3142383 RepID=UPI0039A0A994